MRIDGRLEFRAPETSASSSCILSNTMADPVDDFNELFLFTGTQPSAVHRKRLPLIIILVLADHKEVISSLWCFVESSSNTPWYCHVPHTMFIVYTTSMVPCHMIIIFSRMACTLSGGGAEKSTLCTLV